MLVLVVLTGMVSRIMFGVAVLNELILQVQSGFHLHRLVVVQYFWTMLIVLLKTMLLLIAILCSPV